ncbi:MAG: DNA repair protein RecN, partial [Spirosomaceae bacterium]|nr:DNA repair protein RecN [Spirosomataceae bacterium]
MYSVSKTAAKYIQCSAFNFQFPNGVLSHLLIKNYALIEHLEVQPDANLNIITGETGAGKSIMLGAIGLLMGQRADTKTLHNAEEKCIVEGTFTMGGFYIQNIFEEEELDFQNPCMIRREISPAGKSRAFVNDTPVTLETLRRIGSQLMDVHSQHDTLSLGSNEYQLQIIDTFAQCHQQLVGYQEKFQSYNKLKVAYEYLQRESSSLKKEFDYNKFLLDELDAAKIKVNEQEELEEELNILENAEDVKQRLVGVTNLFGNPEQSVVSMLQDVVATLAPIKNFSNQYSQFVDRIQSALIELKDVANDVENEEEKIELDDERIAIIQQRLDLLFKLHQKHAVKSNTELLEIQETLEQKVSNVLNLSDNISIAKERMEKAKETALKTAEKLSKVRQAVFPEMERKVVQLLAELGIPNAKLKIDHETSELTEEGIDHINFLFSANKGIAPRQLREVASGGEFSRLMLIIKYLLASKRSLPTIIFDEIDTGISGEVAKKVGNMMREMATNIQVISITHLHQIAGLGTTHFYVYKDDSAAKTISKMKQLVGVAPHWGEPCISCVDVFY